MPRNGTAESVYCWLRARDGFWSPDFLHIVKVAYRGVIPPRLLAIVARLEREKPWEKGVAEWYALDRAGKPPTISIVYRDGTVESWQPTPEEWAEAAP